MVKVNGSHVRTVYEKIVDTGTIHYFRFATDGLFLSISISYIL